MSNALGTNAVTAPRLSITPSGGLMSNLKLDPKAAGAGFRRQATSNSTPFPFDVPVIGWKSKFSDSELEQVRLQTVIRHSGWLFKRAQVTLDSKRWFVLENNRLYSYMRQDYLDDETVDPAFPQFPTSIRAVIDLDHCSVKVLTKQKMLLEIQCAGSFCWSKKGNFFSDLGTGRSSSSKTFTFYAEDDTSFQSWVDVLARVEAYKRLKYHLQISTQPRPEPLTLWDLSKESLLRIFCRMQDDKPEFKFFQTKWSALREEDVMFYRRVVLLLNGSHQRAMDRHKQVALQEWEVNNSWKEVFEHITLNKLTSEPVIEVEYPKIEMKLPAENSTLVLKVKERMEIFSDYKAMPRTFLRSLKDLQELKLERLVALADIENWLMLVEPFVEKFVVKPTAVKPVKPSRTVLAPAPPVIIETDEDIEFAKRHMDRAVEYVDILLGQLGSSLLLEDGPICEKGMFKKMYMSVITKLIEAKMLEEKLKETTMTKELKDAAFSLIDIDDEFANPPISASATDDVDDNGNPIQMASKPPKDAAHAPELFSDWEGGAIAVENLSFVTFFVKVHGLANTLLKLEFELQSYFGRIYENLLKKDKTSDEVKGFRPSTMKKEEDVQYLPVNGHIQTVAFRSLKTKVGESVRTDSILQKISSFITVGSFSAHALKFKGCKGYDGELLKLSKQVQSFDAHLTDLYKHSELWLRTIGGDESARRELESRSDHLDVDINVSSALSSNLMSGNRDAKMKKQFDGLASDIWKLFIAGKNDVSIPAIVKARADCVKRRTMSVSQALASFAEVIMCQIKTFFHGSCPDFWHILDLIGAFTLTVSCLVSVFHDEMGMLDDTYNACRWVIDRRLMIRLKLMPFNLQTEQDSDFFWTLCEDLDGSGSKSSRNPSDNTSAYNMRFRSFPCEKKEASGSPCLCRVCKSHPLPLWDETSESRYDEDSSHFQSFRAKAAPSDFLQPVLVIHIRKKYWDKIPSFIVDPSDPTHLRFDYPLFPIFNNVGINENQRRAAAQAPSNFLMQNRVNTDAAAVFTVRHNSPSFLLLLTLCSRKSSTQWNTTQRLFPLIRLCVGLCKLTIFENRLVLHGSPRLVRPEPQKLKNFTRPL
jgi:hypothetical protein